MTTIKTEYEKMLQHILDNGVHKTDRTGTGTKSVFGYQMRFNLQEGFPLITTKKVHFKSIAYELFWFLMGTGNTQYLSDNKVRIWDEWKDDNGDLGPVYGSMWRYFPTQDYNEIVKIERRQDEYSDYEYSYNEILPSIECDLNTEELWAIENLGTSETNKNTSYKVQFKSGYITTMSRPAWKTFKNTQSADRYKKNVAGVGFLGEPVMASEKVYNLWYNMIMRCYAPNHSAYRFYGERGVTVSPIWHSFEMFVKTLSLVPLHHLWLLSCDDYELDKDYYASKVYSPTTTIFLPATVNKRISSNGSAIQIKEKVYSDWGHFETLESTRTDYMKSRLLSGKTYKDYSPEDVISVLATDEYVWRPKVYIDQIADVIEQIKATPDSRRLIVNAWNPAALPLQALPPCHAFFQFYVANGKLSCQLYQRSGDAFLGIPFNIASYALLTHMIAQQTGLEVGDFVHTIGDAHIYDNHKEQVALQLSRNARPFPKLILKKAESIDDYKYEDIVIEGYDPHPLIRGAVAV